MNRTTKLKLAALVAIVGLSSVALADQVTPDDLIIQSSLCVGVDCVNNENFGFDTIRIKENNTRLRFDDTSSSASFPRRDWQLIANDSVNGGGEYFALEDSSAGSVPFRIDGNAPTAALYVASSGHVGLGTGSPQQTIHARASDSPALRLEQDGTRGFGAQSWDLLGNEANFALRDVNAMQVPVRVRPGAPNSSLDIASGGNVGLGTSRPAAFLHIKRNAGTGSDPLLGAGIRVETAPTNPEEVLALVATNNGPITQVYSDTHGAQLWYVRAGSDLQSGTSTYEIAEANASAAALSISPGGDVTIAGTLAQGSSRAIKHDIRTVDSGALLHAVQRLGIHRWRYDGDRQDAEHIGPMAEDFHAAFGVGADDKHIASIDASGIALASVQALSTQVEAENRALKARNRELERRLQTLEAAVERLSQTRPQR